MSTISLRAYVREIEFMIDQGRIEEAIAHCKQILSRFPKHIETYRLLGKTFLENGQNSNAADIFQRVLSAVPDDFISHVGMSLIREEEGNLVAAVEHMERAFERQPYNNAIQEELRRLYGKRDGIEPSKVRLTQGALARIYLKGELINQGISELNAAIKENPERYDLRTILAEAYASSDQMAKAIDTASDILKKFPFNISANRILANTLKTHDRPEEMAICRKRLFSLSPYEAYISKHAPTLDQVPDRAITLEKLDWDGTSQSFRTRTREDVTPWSNTQSSENEINSQAEDAEIPDWLKSNPQEEESLMPEDRPNQPPNEIPDDQNSPSSSDNNEEEQIPDWMKDAGWEPSDGTVDESQSAFDELEDLEDLSEDELAPAEIPAWLEEAAPTGVLEPPESEKQKTDAEEPDLQEPELSIEDEPALRDTGPDDSDDGLVSSDMDSPLSDLPKVEPDEPLDESPVEPADDIPSWLKDLELDEDSQETAIAWLENMPEELLDNQDEDQDKPDIQPGSETETSPTSDYKDELELETPSSAEIDDELEAQPDWLEELASGTDSEEQDLVSGDIPASELLPEDEEITLFDEDEISSSSESQLPSWLDELDSEDQAATEDQPPSQSTPLEVESDLDDSIVESPTDADDQELPDWLSSQEQTPEEDFSQDSPESTELRQPISESEYSPAETESVDPGSQEDAIPDWLDGLDQETDREPEETLDFSTGDESLEWLESLADDQHQLDALDEYPDEPSQEKFDEPPAKPEVAADLSQPVEDTPQEDDDLPSWLMDFEGQEEQEIQAAPPELEPETPEEDELTDSRMSADDEQLPDWLSNLDDQGQSVEAPAAEESVEPVEESVEPVEDSEFQTAAANEETLNKEFPDWLSALGDQEDSEKTKSGLEEDDWFEKVSEKPLEDFPEDEVIQEEPQSLPTEAEKDISDDWLGDLREEVPSTSSPPETASMQEENELGIQDEDDFDDMPAWLSELDTDESETLAEAIQNSDRPLSDEEIDFLEQADDDQAADWLDELDFGETEPEIDQEQVSQSPSETAPPRTSQAEEPPTPAEVDEPEVEKSSAMLEHLSSDQEKAESDLQLEIDAEPELEPEVPQWLENLKNEEDPQETAILWLQQFVNQGDQANLHQEIKRYTDELDAGDSIPSWMKDLQHEEDPQTTAMLWLEKLEDERQGRPEKTPPASKEPDDSGWLAELEKEEQLRKQDLEEVEDEAADELFESDQGWLADLESEQKLQEDEDGLPDWSQGEKTESEELDTETGETPPWMKATSPLEGDFFTDELQKGQDREVEIPDWLAGYTDEELAQQQEQEEQEQAEQPSVELPEEEEYGWFSSDEPKKPQIKKPLDLNKAAISELESIIGISYQTAKGIVTYREKQGPFRTIEDLLNVPEITDQQTIEILKPEITIQPVDTADLDPEVVKDVPITQKADQAPSQEPEQTEQVAEPESAAEEQPAEEVQTDLDTSLVSARSLIEKGELDKALKIYDEIVEEKTDLDQVIEDLEQASQNHPLNIQVLKTLGDAYMQTDNLQEALDAYSKAEELLQ